jgi:hypothetical protein
VESEFTELDSPPELEGPSFSTGPSFRGKLSRVPLACAEHLLPDCNVVAGPRVEKATRLTVLKKRGKLDTDVPESLEYLRHFVEPVERDLYATFENEARERLRGRDRGKG